MSAPAAAPAATPAATAIPAGPRQRVIDAAVTCFAQSGFHGASMQQICAAANMSPGALYRYFPSKVSIIAAIAEAEREKHKEFFEQLAEAEDPVEALVSIGSTRLEQILTGPNSSLCAETIAEAARNPAVRGMFDRNLAEARAHMVAALQRGQAQGKVDPTLDVDTACRLIMAMGEGLSVHQGLASTLSAERMRPVLQILLRRFLRPAAVALLAWVVAGALAGPGAAWAEGALPRPPSVTVVAAAAGSIAESVTLTGTLVAREEVLVSPQIDGVAINALLAEEGDRVVANQVLARLSREVLEASLAQNTAPAWTRWAPTGRSWTWR
jgi:TetR/AcrR family transcriptional repressor of uid operon